MTESDPNPRADDPPPPPAGEPAVAAASAEPVPEPTGPDPLSPDPAGPDPVRPNPAASAASPSPSLRAAEADAAPTAARRSGNAALWTAVALLFLMTIAAGGLAWLALHPELRAGLPGPLGLRAAAAKPDPRLATLDTRIDGLARTVATLSARADALDRERTERDADPGRAVAPTGDVADLRAQIQALAQRVQAVDATVQTARAEPQAQDLSNQMTAVAARLDRIAADQQRLGTEQQRLSADQQTAAQARQQVALGLSIANLEGALLTGRPYARQIEALRGLAPQAAALPALAARAETGVPTAADLAARFPALADRAIEADRQAGAEGWFGRLWARLRTLVIVRPVGEVPGTDTASVLARAQARLDRGDLDGAVREASALAGPAAGTIAPWLADARARLAAEAELAALRDRLLNDLARRG